MEEDEALEEAENAEAASLVEEQATEGVDTLLAEVDSHLSSDSEVDADTSKGTPGNSIAAGMTWEDAQTERLNALQSKLEAEKAATPKVQAQVVASKEELNALDEQHQNPEYNVRHSSRPPLPPILCCLCIDSVLSGAVLCVDVVSLRPSRWRPSSRRSWLRLLPPSRCCWRRSPNSRPSAVLKRRAPSMRAHVPPTGVWTLSPPDRGH